MHAFEFLIMLLMVAFLGLFNKLWIAREPQLWLLKGSSASALVNPNEVESINTKKDQHLRHQPEVRKPRILNQDVTALLKKQQTPIHHTAEHLIGCVNLRITSVSNWISKVS